MTIEKKSPCGHRFFAGKNEEKDSAGILLSDRASQRKNT